MDTPIVPAASQPVSDPRVARVRSFVLKLFAVVMFTLFVGFVFMIYNYATDRTVREAIFGNDVRVH